MRNLIRRRAEKVRGSSRRVSQVPLLEARDQQYQYFFYDQVKLISTIEVFLTFFFKRKKDELNSFHFRNKFCSLFKKTRDKKN